jgi:isopentenyl-diphosphate delta-isomerase
LAEAALDAAVVSFDDEALILVDEDDNEVGKLSKAECHVGDGVLHRAFSLFIFDRDGRLLLQQRSAEKLLWPMYWSNSCCSHPRHGETMDEAVHRRLDQELRMTSELHYLYKFQYQARFRDLGSEHELCWVYVGISEDAARPNPHEVAAHRWVTPEELDHEMTTRAETLTPWFQMEWREVRGLYRATLGL